MADRELKIIAEARITLNDLSVANPRWADSRLIELLSDGQDDMCKLYPMISKKAIINTSSGQSEYKLPNGSVKLLSGSTEGRPLTITSTDEIERDFPEWEEDIGPAFLAIIVNEISQNVIRPYPLASTGVSKAIKVRYQAMPIRLGWEGDGADPEVFDTVEELTINDMWNFALKQYVIGMAFLDYGDEASISRSQVALSLYNKELAKIAKLTKKSFAKRSRTTGFQGKVQNTRYLGGRYGSGSSRFRY